jgi:phosphoglycerate dehydrogenase-like enzyme
MKVKVSTIAFSKNPYLVSKLQHEFPDCVVNESGVRMNDLDLVNFFSDADAVIVGLESITSNILNQLPKLKMISKYGVGIDNINVEECNKRNIVIGWTGGVNKRAVAEMTIGFMIALIRNLYLTSNQLKKTIWNKNGGLQLTGKTIGIIGLGNIGKDVVELLKPFNCRILVNDINDINEYVLKNGLISASKENIYRESDIITIHTPLNDVTRNLIGKNVFDQMKTTAFLINTARGGIVNELELKQALNDGSINGAALDVYYEEPANDIKLLGIPNLICTPHIGGNSQEAVIEMGMSAIKHLINFKNNNYKENEFN